MFSSNFKNISVFIRLVGVIPRQSHLLKHYHCRPRIVKHVFGNGKSNRKNNFKALGLTAVAGAYACSFISKRSDETEDEFVELLYQESLKEDIQLLTIVGKIPYLIVGCSPAAISAYRAIRIKDPTAKVIMVCEERLNPYNYPALARELWYIKDQDPVAIEQRLFYDVDYLPVQQMLANKNGGLSLIRGKKVVKIDPVSQSIILETGENIAYEKCLLATGTKPVKLNIFEEAENMKNYWSFLHTLQDFIELEKGCEYVESVAVIGNGFLASELASGLSEFNKSRDLSVIQIYPEARILSDVLPEYLSQIVEKKFQHRNIHVMPNVTVKSVAKGDGTVDLHLSNKEIVSVHHVIVAIGSEPDTDLALSSGLETDDKCGGYLVNAELRARNNLWVAGESASFYDPKFGRRRVEHYVDAMESGRVAGMNITGDSKLLSLRPRWLTVLAPDTFCEGFGKVDSKLETVGIFVAPSSHDERPKDSPIKSPDDYGKGFVFYLSDDVIVGILLWNFVVGDPRIVWKVIEQSKLRDDVVEIAKLLQSHSVHEQNE